MVRKSLKAVVKVGGYQACDFVSAEQYHEQAASIEDVAAIIIDYRLPGQSGLELAKSIRQQGNTVPIILLSGNFDPPAIETADSLNDVATLQKPCSPKEILKLIHQLSAPGR